VLAVALHVSITLVRNLNRQIAHQRECNVSAGLRLVALHAVLYRWQLNCSHASNYLSSLSIMLER